MPGRRKLPIPDADTSPNENVSVNTSEHGVSKPTSSATNTRNQVQPEERNMSDDNSEEEQYNEVGKFTEGEEVSDNNEIDEAIATADTEIDIEEPVPLRDFVGKIVIIKAFRIYPPGYNNLNRETARITIIVDGKEVEAYTQSRGVIMQLRNEIGKLLKQGRVKAKLVTFNNGKGKEGYKFVKA